MAVANLVPLFFFAATMDSWENISLSDDWGYTFNFHLTTEELSINIAVRALQCIAMLIWGILAVKTFRTVNQDISEEHHPSSSSTGFSYEFRSVSLKSYFKKSVALIGIISALIIAQFFTVKTVVTAVGHQYVYEVYGFHRNHTISLNDFFNANFSASFNSTGHG